MPEFYITIARKVFFSKFGGHVLPLFPLLRICAEIAVSSRRPLKRQQSSWHPRIARLSRGRLNTAANGDTVTHPGSNRAQR